MGYTSRIAVGVDFSDTAARAMNEARVLAERLGALLEIVHVREDRSGKPWDPDDAAVAWMESQGVGAADLTTRGGTPWLELARYTWAPGAELLVVGTHGRSGAQSMALGSTASRLVLASPRPVVLVGNGNAGGRSTRVRDSRSRTRPA